MNGIIVLNKEKNYTSRDIVNIACKCLNTKKVGHTGTLDPLATGVLILCIGSATKLVEIITSNDKEYIAEVKLGIETDTLDITGKILKQQETIKSKNEIVSVLNRMKKTYLQEVPIYSAIKVNGKKLYEYARENKEVILPKKKVEIKNLELITEPIFKDGITTFKIKCSVSKGTYIRCLIRDIAYELGTIGTMSELTRTKQGIYDINDCNTLDQMKTGNYQLHTIDDILKNFKQVEINNELYNKVKNGALIENPYKENVVVLKKENKVIAIYKKYDKNNELLKPWKMFLNNI